MSSATTSRYATPPADPLRTTVFTANFISITDFFFTGNRSFTYDDLNRLTYASGTFGPGQSQANCSYTYNSIGNLTNAAKVGANKRFYHNDHLGGVNVIMDITGAKRQLNEYDPWGKVSLQTGNCDPTRRFTGQELDPETDLYYYGGRYYDYEISRFVSPDPYVQEPENPQNLNRYSYVLNNPQSLVDPNGHFIEWIVAIAAAIATVAEVASAEVITAELIQQAVAKIITYGILVSLNQSRKVITEAELQREVAKQQHGDNVRRTLTKVDSGREDPLSKETPGNDPNEERSWWKDVWNTVGPSDAHAGDDEGGGRIRLPRNVRYGVIQRAPAQPTGRLAEVVYKNQKLFRNWLRAEQSAKRIGNPLTADEANRVIQQAQKLGIKKGMFDFNKAGLQGMEKTSMWKDIPHFKIGRTHIPIELGFTPPW